MQNSYERIHTTAEIFQRARQSQFRHARSYVANQCGSFENFLQSVGGRNPETIIPKFYERTILFLLSCGVD